MLGSFLGGLFGLEPTPNIVDILADRRVGQGMEFLDRTYGRGNWEGIVNRRLLDIQYDSVCMMGQLEGSYNRQLESGGVLHDVNPVSLAFMEDNLIPFGALTRAWDRALARRTHEFYTELQGERQGSLALA